MRNLLRHFTLVGFLLVVGGLSGAGMAQLPWGHPVFQGGSTGATCGDHTGQLTSWNPADKNAAIVLSNSNFTWFLPSGGGAAVAVRTTGITHTTGKWYALHFADLVTAANGVVIGVSNSGASLNNYPGNSASVGFYSGNIYVNGVGVGSGPLVSSGLYEAVAVDFDAHLFWGGTFLGPCSSPTWSGPVSNDGNPSTGFHGTDISSIQSGAMMIIAGGFDAAGNNQGTLFSSTVVTEPTLFGYKYWDQP